MHRSATEEPLSSVLERLERKGYREDLRAHADGLHAAESGRVFAPEALVIDEVARFEGDSDPGDEAVVFALSSPQEGPIGTFVVPFGPSMQPVDVDMVHRLEALRH